MTKFKSINDEVGEFFLSHYGEYPAFCFIGPEDFIKRTINLFENYGTIKVGKHSMLSNSMHYFLAPTERILSAIKSCFRAEIIINKLPEAKIRAILDEEGENLELTYDDEAIDSLAEAMTNEFWNDKVQRKDLFTYFSCIGSEFYEVRGINSMNLSFNL
jgi:hypothetical protein